MSRTIADRVLRGWPVALTVLLTAACQQPLPRPLTGETAAKVDFSGHWELNYQLSDNVQEKTQQLLMQARAQMQRDQRGLPRQWVGLPTFEVVELTDSVSRIKNLEIDQDAQGIEIQRGEEFPLTCSFGPQVPLADIDPLGAELCGWDQHQLVFAFQLSERVSVTERLTLSPDRRNLNVATTVRSRGSGPAFTLNRVYDRFEPLPDEYDCQYTLTRGNSCRRGRPDGSASSQQ